MWMLLVMLVMLIVSYALMPKVKNTQPVAMKDMDNPTAETGRAVPVIFGTITISGVNTIWYGDKQKVEKKVKA